ncbi:hypothetical protein ASPWEDRAFT_109908 [Aspergillus wentii DTO 134E9]|uniref:Xylanolytic transcriptional activator regulatory domain-containing protein n=1 Tax=Aspergillus wentii DTO 134E9 TaxID=1073089 RepID=A0A1L9RKE9_ASPWE|nr:uncharacterized protein ASPWEDRAFT_109908 [Aspergillus wentii DTO 134E9]OJJ35383.1 hypothetical protein ASPWEDRAFT_109908 [Aspergillus wentii DTO 134E9]
MQVRCDRGNPCGNCQDTKSTCSRDRTVRRIRKCVSRQQRERSRSLRLQSVPETGVDEAEASLVERVVSSNSPKSNVDEVYGAISRGPLYDAQFTIQHQLKRLQGLTLDRRQVLESALCVPRQLLDDFGDSAHPNGTSYQIEEQPRVPSAELLAWMLKDIESDRFGPYVADYFRHISKATLKHMGLSLLRKEASPHDSTLYTVCFNAMAFKFHTTTMNMDNDSDLLPELQQSALQYRETAQAALQKIPMLIPPSLALLQALLCGIFLHQGSGNASLCWELTKSACRTCIDIGLDTIVLQGKATEEEYYCFMWCYMLDRNYVFKLGRTRCFLDIQLPSDTSVNHRPMGELLQIYVDLARVQAAVIPYLQSQSGSEDASLHAFKGSLLQQMQRIHERIDHIASLPSPWKGLDIQTEVAALKFAYHSVMTAIFYLFETHDAPRKPYLQSARQELSALVAMCLSAEKQSVVAFLHWTILFYPLTAYFVLFCNVVATSDTADFNLMKAIADCLNHGGTVSRPIAQLRVLFQKFLSLSSGFFERESGGDQTVQVQVQHPSYPVESPFLLPWGENGTAFNQSMLGVDGYEGFNVQETWPFLAFNDSVSFLDGDVN